MTMSLQSVVRGAVVGTIAGAVGTLAMDLVWYRRYRREGGEERFGEWELSASGEGFDDAGAPAQVGRRMVKALARTDLADELAGVTNNVVHWGTGAQWGAIYGVAVATTDAPRMLAGLGLGPAAWGTSYLLLGAAGIYEPIWRYDRETLTKDLTAHLVFGTATAAAFGALRGSR